jgi:putative endonuclease
MHLERGRVWEGRAAQYLEDQGLRIVERGYRCRVGELDLVCRDERHLVVVEVRARATGAKCSAIESIGPGKQRRIVLATRHLLLRHPEWHAAPIRFDVVAFDDINGPEPKIHWIRNAFDAS